MSLTDIYGSGNSNFLKATDLGNERPTLFIAEVAVKETNFTNNDGTKKKQLVLTFYGQDKVMGLNVTQARAIEQLYGGDWNNWVNKGIRLYQSTTKFEGQTKPTIAIYPDQFSLTPEQIQQGQAWLAEKRAKEAAEAQAPQFTGPPQQQSAFAAPPPSAPAAAPAPAPTEGSQFNTAPSFGSGSPFGS